MKRLCLILNVASHYRTSIYQLIDSTYNTSFYFSEPYEDIKLMDYALLKQTVTELRTWRWHNFSYQLGAIKLLRRDFDCYITLGDVRSLSTWLLLVFAKLIRKDVIVWTHGWYGKETKLEIFIKKIFYKLPKKVFLYGDYAKRLMIDHGVNPNKLIVVHNSLDHNKQSELRSKMSASMLYLDHFGNDNPVIIIICRLTPRKRIDMLLDAVSLLIRDRVECNVVIVGEGPEKEKLQQKTNELNLAKYVWFYGACYSEKDNAELIYNADLCVTPGDVGLTAIHAMTFGVPVITHDYFPSQGPEFEAIKNGVTGTFFENGNVLSLAKTIDGWLKNKSTERDSVRKACYQEIDENWTPQFQMNVIKSVIG